VADLHPFKDLFDAAIRHSAVRVTCDRCRHTVTFKTAALWRHFQRMGWDHRFAGVQRRLFCLRCWYRGGGKVRPSIQFCDDEPTDTRFPMPSKAEWAQAARRRR
jgi:hypothetical protein